MNLINVNHFNKANFLALIFVPNTDDNNNNDNQNNNNVENNNGYYNNIAYKI